MKRLITKGLAGLIGGFLLAVFGSFVVRIALQGFIPLDAVAIAHLIAFGVLCVASFAITLSAPAAAQAWRRILITSGLTALLLPTAGLLFAAALIHAPQYLLQLEAPTATIMGLIGLCLGPVLLIVGLLIGRRNTRTG